MKLLNIFDKKFQFFVIFLFFNEIINKFFSFLNINISLFSITQLINISFFLILITNYMAGKNQFQNLKFKKLIYWMILISVPLVLELVHFISGEKLGINIIRNLYLCMIGSFLGFYFSAINKNNFSNISKLISYFFVITISFQVFTKVLGISNLYYTEIVSYSIFWLLLKTLACRFYKIKINDQHLDYILSILTIIFSILNFTVGPLIYLIVYFFLTFNFKNKYLVFSFLFLFLILINIDLPIISYLNYFYQDNKDIFLTGLDGEIEYFNIDNLQIISSYPQYDQIMSTYIRNYANKLVFEQFLNSPIIGNGLSVIYNLKIVNYRSHTYILLLLGSYGIFGILIFIGQSISFVNKFDIRLLLKFFIFILITSSFTGDFPPIYSFLGVWTFTSLENIKSNDNILLNK